jgi:hypothetical protein
MEGTFSTSTASCTIALNSAVILAFPLEGYTRAHLEHEYYTVKPCAPHGTIPCVQGMAVADEFREEKRSSSAVVGMRVACSHVVVSTAQPAQLATPSD